MPPEKHALLSASSAGRWLNCTASVALSKGVPEERSAYADEGTLAHELGELKLRRAFLGMPEEEYQKSEAKLMSDPAYNTEMQSCTDEYVRAVGEILQNRGEPLIALEQRVDYSEYAPEGFGTSDCTILSYDPYMGGVWELDVVDYKHGKGVAVSAVDNPQLKLYGLGALAKVGAQDDIEALLTGAAPREITEVTLHVVQPRTPDGNSSFTVSVKDLLEWAENVVKPIALQAFNGEGEPNPGAWCKNYFCPIRNTCRARAKKVLEFMFDDRVMQDAKTLSEEELAELLALTEEFIPWRKGLYAQSFKIANAGKPIPGYKVVRGRSDRKWKSEQAVKSLLASEGVPEEKIVTQKVLSPAQIEGVLGKERFSELLSDLVEKPEGAPTLVPDTDRRSAVNAAQDDFKEFL